MQGPPEKTKEKHKAKISLADFSMLSLIAIGNYSKVVLVRKTLNDKIYAMKVIKKRTSTVQPAPSTTHTLKPPKPSPSHAYIERQILARCNHPFIVKMHSTFQHHKKLYYVLEFCPGGELFGAIKRQKRLEEEIAKFYAAQIFVAVSYLHAKGYVYRDLKPENVLLDRKGYIRLVDFGLSCKLQREGVDLIAGTPEYLPPEIFEPMVSPEGQQRQIGTWTDWWAFGSLIFEMITGFPAFFSPSLDTMRERIIKQAPPLHFISNPALKDLLTGLLDKNPRKRLGSQSNEQIKSHPWFAGTPWQALLRGQVPAPFVPKLANDIDTRWFELEEEPKEKLQLTPPDSQSQKNTDIADRYDQFSLSWRSGSQGRCSPTEEIEDDENSQITIKIVENAYY